MTLIFFGGCHGVGKTRLIEMLLSEPGIELRLFDPGEYFWKHLYELKDMTAPEIEELVAQELANLPGGPHSILVNWHYAVWTPKGYVPQLSEEYFGNVAQSTKSESIMLCLVEASAETILERRLSDKKRKRKCDLQAVREEIDATNASFENHMRIARSYRSTSLLRIDNSSLSTAEIGLSKLRTFICDSINSQNSTASSVSNGT